MSHHVAPRHFSGSDREGGGVFAVQVFCGACGLWGGGVLWLCELEARGGYLKPAVFKYEVNASKSSGCRVGAISSVS